ncbi:M1 family metallopeptidase [Henriciella litoralis]|uniref:M1 family metallopeptidase n=1 Tax=Henriciella litoralis TaxID=568102 RepID=UPI000A02A697|nr:M1 family metallopeptidase [Henriciella litoralis]
MTLNRFKTSIFASVACLALLAGCGPKDSDKSGPEAEATAPENEPVKLETPPAGQLPDDVIPTAYSIDLITDPAQSTFEGKVEIDIRLDQPHARIWLHSLDQTIERAFVRLDDGTEIEGTFEGGLADGGVSKIDFAEPVPDGNATLVMEYTAPYNMGLAGLYKATQNGRPYLATQQEPIDARRMFPGFDEPRFKTPWTLTVTAPAGNQVIANAPSTGTSQLDNGMVKHTFAPTRPIQSYLIALAVGPYDMREGTPLPANTLRAKSVPFRGFAPAGKGDQLKTAMDITDAMVSQQEAYFNFPYPYAKLDIIAVPDFAYGAMENAGAIIYRESALLISDRTTEERKRGILTTHAHELAHQWFGNLVTPAWWDDIWLNEAFATWMANKTMNSVYPGTGYDRASQRNGIGAMGADSLKNARQIRNPIERNADINDAFDSITYRKGGHVLSMFESYLGEDAFREGIRLHMKRFEDDSADVDDFMTSIADGSGDKDVVESFRSFIFQPGIPYLNVETSCSDDDAGVITVTQQRYAPLGSDIDMNGQTWLVPLEMRVSGPAGDQVIRQMLTETETEFPLDAGCADWVMPNTSGGYWRFALSDDNWAALTSTFDTLSPTEQLAFIDSITAAFRAGDAPAASVFDALEAAATSDWDVAIVSLDRARSYYNALPAEDRAPMRDWAEATYRPVQKALMARKDTLDENDTLLLQELSSTLLEIGKSGAERRALAKKANALVGVDGDPDPSAVPPAEFADAIKYGAQLGGEAFYKAALDYARTTQDQRERRIVLSVLAANVGEAELTDLYEQVQSDDWQGQEAWSVLQSSLGNDQNREKAWELYKANFDAVLPRTPEIRKAQTAGGVANFCTPDETKAARAFYTSKAKLMPGYERSLAQGEESANLCSAFRDEKAEELKKALSEE